MRIEDALELRDLRAERDRLRAELAEARSALEPANLLRGIDFHPTLGMDGGDVDRLLRHIADIRNLVTARARAALDRTHR